MSNSDDNDQLKWMIKGECGKPENAHLRDNFFSGEPQKKYEAKNLCFTCEVREPCVKWALENKEIWGIWGAKDENEIRRTLSVNADGNEVRRGRYPQCPACSARTSRLTTKVIDLPDGGRWTTAKVVECTVCHFEWRSRSSANAVAAYFAEREAIAARNAKRRAEIAARNKKRASTK